jgi:cobalt-zinc-cadmium efflux system outer membrane protein
MNLCRTALAGWAVACACAGAETPPALPAGPLTLARAEEMLLERSQAVANARRQLEVSEALNRIAGYRPNPTLHVGAEQIPFRSPAPDGAPRFFATNLNAAANPTYTLQVNKTIERGGKRERRVEQAAAGVEAGKAQILDAFRLQLFQLRQAFTTAILARDNLRLAETIDREYAETERLTTVRVKSGDLAGVEASRVRAGRLPYRQATLEAQLALQQAKRDILNLLDAPGGDAAALTIEGELSDAPVAQPLAELRERVLRDRPDVTAARAALKAADAGVALAEAQRKRDVTVGLEYQRSGEDHVAGVTADIPLFVYNNQKAAIAQAVAQKRVAESQLRLAETQALTDLDKAYQAYLTARQALAVYGRDGMAEAARVRDVISYSYRRGEASLFELLDAQRTASQAAVASNQTRFNYQMSLWQIEQAIGGSLR